MTSVLSLFIATGGTAVYAVLPLLLLGTVAVVGCGKKRPPAKRADNTKNHRNKRDVSSKRASDKKTANTVPSMDTSKKSSTVQAGATQTKPLRELLQSCPLHPSDKPIMNDIQDSTTKSQELAITQSTRSQSSVQNVLTARCLKVPAAFNYDVLKVQPEHLSYAQTGGIQSVLVGNYTGERQAIKVKCTDNMLYRVSPVFAFVENGQQLKVDVMRQNGSAKVDKLVLHATSASASHTSAEALFTPKRQYTTMIVPLHAMPSEA